MSPLTLTPYTHLSTSNSNTLLTAAIIIDPIVNSNKAVKRTDFRLRI